MIDQRSAQACGGTLGLLAESRGRLGHIHEDVMLLGGDELAAIARMADVVPFKRVGAPLGSAVLAWSAARRAAAGLSGGERYDLIHCWSTGALSLATLLFRTTPRVLTNRASANQRDDSP